MKALCTWILVLVAGTAALLPAGIARASTRGVKDNADFFSAEAKQQANAIIDDIFRKHHEKEVLVETFATVPEGSTYQQFVQERFRAARLNGVYIVIVRQGGQVSVRADQTTARLFTDLVCSDLARRLSGNLKKGKAQYDAALIDAVQFVSDTFGRGETRTGAGAGSGAAQRSSPGSYSPPVSNSRNTSWLPSGIMGWVCLGVGVWIVIALVRSIFAGRGGYGAGGYPGGPGPGYGGGGPGYGGYGGGGYGGGGGWGSSMLGGLFGAAAGSWLYDRFSHSGGSAYGAPPSDTGGYVGGGVPSTPDWAGPGDSGAGGGSGGDASFGGGGDFGGGGADFGGGGDAGGGGDFGGGGDAGGGGDFA